ncbi:aldehyde dehydrogenase family protein [Paracoccus sp. (in: a-proteobacteria)]|uniref:aldehyde dehydrogenase family protein n=1 Tax=Paracoccus sp. TaxID=267 RepID=UPI002AFE0B19|nr:aldehyde dehydrogenase family protein [Paracoccus sp. (in: a-proteobacteria)]
MNIAERGWQPVTARARIGAEWRDDAQTRPVHSPYDGHLVGHMPVSTLAHAEEAIAAAKRASAEMARMPGYERATMLRRIADEVAKAADEIAVLMCRETGKAIRDCLAEARRAPQTIRLCAEEATRIEGEHIPMDATQIGAGKLAMMLRFPLGVVSAITPFNGPVHLATHKVGPALAAGNAVILKPSPKAPLSVHRYIEAIIAAGLPDGAVNALYGDDVGPKMISDERVDFVSFTGSIPVGKIIRDNAGMKRVALELGGVGPTFVHHDANLTEAAKACAFGAVAISGQSCVSVQNVYVHDSVREEFTALVEAELAKLKFGDPLDAGTDIGTLIDEAAAKRVMGMIERAEAKGAKIHCGAERNGAQINATLLSNVSDQMDIVTDEIFGPAFSIQGYDDPEPIFQAITESRYGLQCGIYTNSLDLAMRCFRQTRTGGVVLNATSRWRSDQMPYGGVKDSGMGREGPRYTIREMTEERLLIIT